MTFNFVLLKKGALARQLHLEKQLVAEQGRYKNEKRKKRFSFFLLLPIEKGRIKTKPS
jgi:hypothetical protein